MNHLSISSSDRFARSRPLLQFQPRILTASFGAIVVLLALIELTLRIPFVQNALPIRTHLHEPGVVVRLQTLERLKLHYGHIDALFIGSSIVRCNIRPLLFDDLIQRETGAKVVSFNAGMSGLWPAAVRLYAERLWIPEARPRLVVQGIRYGELVPSPRARKYDEIVTSPVESAWEEPGLSAWLRANTYRHLHLLQYRGVWPMWLRRFERGRSNAPEDDELRVFTDPRGWTPRLPTLSVNRARNLLRGETPNPALDPHASAEAFEAIRQTARAAQRSGARYVLVNVPEHAFRWSGSDGRARYATYLAALRRVAADEHVTFIDVTDADPYRFSNDADYADYHHMSPEGAARFTTLLATTIGRTMVTNPAN
jgi:hypothetical protein